MEGIRAVLSRYLSPPTINILLIIVLLFTSIPSNALAQVAKNSPPTKPIDVTATQIGLNQVDVRWTKTDLSTTGYRIERTSDPSFLTGVTKTSVSRNDSAFSDKTISVGNVYFYRVFAYNSFGDSLPSNVAIVSVSNSFLPSPGIPQIPPVVTTEQPSSITENSATLVGSLKQIGSAGRVLTYFQWGYDTGYGNIAEPKALSAPDSFSIALKNLRPNRTYHYRAVAVGQGVGTVYGDDRVFTTPPSTSPSSALRPAPPAIILGGSQSVVIRASAAQDNDLKSPSKKINVKLPKGALNRDADIELTEYGPVRTPGKQILSQFELKAKEVGTSASVRQFGKDLEIKIVHDADDLKGLDTRSLHLYYFDEGRKTWVPVPSTYDAKTRTLTATVNHFTYFSEMANPLKSGPGLITAFQNDLQTGAATGTYPIEVPPGPGGFQPKITLQYNSGSVDEMKNKRSVGSWVGIGWSLSLGSISYDEANNKYSLELNGTGYTLVEGANNTYYTHPDKYLKVTRNGNQWDVRDRDGNYYRFGGTNDSQQYHDTNVYYRWDLSRMQGAASNLTFIDITYTQDTWNGTIRSAYPSVLKYTDGQGNDTVRISFNSSFDYTSADGNMRFDTPNGTTLNPIPPIVENKKLDTLEIRVYASGNWTLVRKYSFAYNTTNSYYSADYGGIYYSGNFTLASITQKDSSGNLSLPATTFTYEGKQTYLLDTSTSNYSGNPGNPASFNWPHLTTINNGYGANVTYTYTQIPDASITDIWTRQVVAIKTVNSGIGPEETHIYTYIGYPQYLVNDGNEWAAKFRGFTQVQDTDAAGNYVMHYFNTIDPDDGTAEKLNGLETKTEWYSSNGTLLRKVENQWGWSESVQAYDLLRRWGAISQFAGPKDVAVADNGTIFVADTNNNRILKYTANGTLIGMWGSPGTGNGQLNNPSGIAAIRKADDWWNTSWSSRTKLTFNMTSISTNLSNFPVMVHLTPANFNFARAQADGGDIRFIDADNVTELNYEIEKWSANESWIWVKVPTLTGNSTTKYIWMYYDNSNAPNGWNTNGVWDANFKGVWHMSTNSTGGLNATDSTSNGNNGTVYGVSPNSSGKVDGAGQFNGTNNYINIGSIVPNVLSVGSWFKTQSPPGSQYDLVRYASYGYGLFMDASGKIGFYINDAAATNYIAKSTSSYADDNWHYAQGVYTGNYIYVYIDGVLVGSSSAGTLYCGAGGFTAIGRGGVYDVCYFKGTLDEVRISNTARSSDWIKASYISGNDSLITYSASIEYSYVYVADTANNRIQYFNLNGVYLGQWGNNGTGNGNFTSPRGIAVGLNNTVYVIDTGNHRVQKFSENGSFIYQWGSSGNGSGNFSYPEGIAASPDGYIYVADTNNNRIQKFNSSGNFTLSWGASGNGSGNFSLPRGVVVDSFGNVYVSDSGNNRIQKFTSNGSFIAAWGSPGPNSSQFNSPFGLGVDSHNNTYVADTNNNRIQKFDGSGNFSAAWGSYGSGNASLATPKGVAVSGNGSVYVVDSNSNHILKFTGIGNYITSWGSYGNSTGQFAYPYGIAIGPDGSIYVADKENNRVQKFTGSGNYTTSWGGYGNVTGNFNSPTGIAVENSSYVYVVDTNNNRIQKFTSNGTFVAAWGNNTTLNLPQGIAIGPDGYIYVADTGNHSVQKFTSSGNFVAAWGGFGTANGKFDTPRGIAIDTVGNIYVADSKNYRVQVFNSSGNFVASWITPFDGDYTQREPVAVAAGSNGYVYVTSGSTVKKFARDFSVRLDQVTETVGSKVTQTRYVYDSYGNVVTEYQDGDTTNVTDNRTIWRVYYPNTGTNILGKVARERVYSGTVTTDNGGANLKSETLYYYDGNDTSYNVSPTKGLLTRVETKKDASNSISSYLTYDGYGNRLTEKDPNGNITSTVFDSTYRTYPIGKTFPVTGLSENYTYDPGTTNMLTLTDINGQVTTYTYDTFKRLISVDKPLGRNPDIQYEYISWGTLNQQHIKTKTWTDNSTYLWQSQFFDGLGRVVQVQSNGETNYTIVSSTVTYNTRGLVDKEFVTQSLSGNLTSYQTPQANWKYVTYAYDGLGRVTQKINADATWTTQDLATAWQDAVTNELGFNTVYSFDAFNRLIKVTEPAGAPSYDFSLKWSSGGTGNLTSPQSIAVDANGNIFVADTGNHFIKKFNSSGSFIAEYGGYGTVSGNFNGPTGVAVDNNGNFYVADTNNNRIQKFNSNGSFNTTWNGSGNASGTFNHPQGVAVDSNGNIYVADTNNNRVQKFSSNGTFVKTWGAYGSESGNFSYPKGIAVDTNGFVYVADTSNHRIQKFDSNGNFLAVIGSYGTAPGRFNAPAGVAVDAFGIIYVADTDNSRIQKLDSGGGCIVWWGGNGTADGKFDQPYGLVVNQSGNVYVADTNNNRVQKFNPASQSPSPVTNYGYDILGNLVQVTDAVGNNTTISYDWLSRKTAMVDPDMGGWGYTYDKNGNLATQTDNKSQTITFTYDALNRLKGKTYPAGANMTNVTYGYDSGTNGKGQRTSMTDAGGNTTYQYNQRGRLITENRTFTGDNNTYVTRYGYDGADRVIWIVYPTGENVTQSYNGRGLAYAVSGNVAGNLVTSTYYNALGQTTEINLNNGLRTTFGYWGLGGTYDTAGGYYGRLWEIKTLPQAGGTPLLDVQHTWDAGENLASRTDALVSQTETFTYDTLSRLTSVTGPYTETYTYNAIGNILSKNGVSYTYGSKPHAVTSFGSTNYTYDNNGNMLTRGSQNITWDAENRPVSIAFNSVSGTWWSNNWTKRTKLSFNTTTISSNLTNFPVLVHLTSSNFVFGYAQADGGDLRFIDVDGTTVLDYEIEKWTGSEAWVWVKVHTLTGNSTTDFIWMYYGNANASNGWNPSGVWDSDHKMVHHLEETDIDGGNGDIKDTTTYGNNGTTVGMNTADQVAGKVDGNFDFDGTDDHVTVPDNDAWTLGNFTISLWVNANSWAGAWWTRAFVGQDEGGGDHHKWIFSYGNGATLFHINHTPEPVGGPIILGNAWTPQTSTWYYLGITKSGDTYTFYRNGATDGSSNNAYPIPNANAPLTIAWAEGAGGFNGMIDEVRVSNTTRSADWIKASYLSETDAIINYGATENFGGNAWWDTGWSMRNKLTFNTTSISSNLTNFPVLVHLTSSNFSFGYAQADGGDLRFIDANNTTVLDYEIEKWTPSEAWVWVRVPLLSGNSTSDHIWIYWNNANAANGWNPAGVWDANYVLVDHLVDNPDAGHTKDSTNNSNNGTKAGSNQPLETTSKIGRGQTFNGTSSMYIQSGNSSSLNPTNALTIETFAKRSGNGTYAWPHLVTKGSQYLFHAYNSNNACQSNLFINGQWYYLYYANGFPIGEWKSMAVTYDGATGKILDAGQVVTTQNITGTLGISSNIFTTSNTFNGTIDEIRISNIARSTDWLKATYLTQMDNLISFGNTETIGTAATFVYDGDGNRVKKTDNGETILYVNKYYEKNLTTGNVTTYYYSGDRMVAEREATTLRYFHQDSLSSTSLMTDASGGSLGIIKFAPFGSARSGSVPTDIQFTGQRLDATDLYYYGARYYDASVGRFISPDSIVPDPTNPQAFNRYSYVLNNPLKYIDPTGLWWTVDNECNTVWEDDETGEQIPDYVYYARLWNKQATTTSPVTTLPPTTTPPPAPAPAPTPGTPTPTTPAPTPAPAPPQSTVPSLPKAPDQPVVPKTPEPEPATNVGGIVLDTISVAISFIPGVNVLKGVTSTGRVALAATGLHIGWAVDVTSVGLGGRDSVGQFLNVASAVLAPAAFFGPLGVAIAVAPSVISLAYSFKKIYDERRRK